MDPRCPREVADALIAYLRVSLQLPDLGWTNPPERLHGGCQTYVYGFRLDGARPPFDGRLVLRMIRGARDDINVRVEAIIQDTLIEQGYPTPCVLACVEDPAWLGGPFQIMERVSGRPLLLDDFDPEAGSVLSSLLHNLGSASREILGDWPRRLACLHAELHELDAGELCAALHAAGYPETWVSLEGRLARFEASVRESSVDALLPALEWLHDMRPGPDTRISILHGDFFPNQVFCDGSAISGVIDWSDALIGPAEIDVGIVKAGLMTLPLPLPSYLKRAGERLTGWLADRFVSAYAESRPIDERWLVYGEVLRCLVCLVSVDSRRRALAAGARPESIPINPFDHPSAVRRLRETIEARIDLQIAEVCVFPAAA